MDEMKWKGEKTSVFKNLRIREFRGFVAFASGAYAEDQIIFHRVGDQRLPLVEKCGTKWSTNGALSDRGLGRRGGGGGRAPTEATVLGKITGRGGGGKAAQFERRTFDVMTVKFDDEDVVAGVVKKIT